MKMYISIAMATFNGSLYLEEQLESFLRQTRLPDELIICDDVSTDNTILIVKKFAEKAPFTVKIYQNAINLGYSQNFSRALNLCSGDLVFLSDQDDFWLHDKIETVLKIFIEQPKVQLVIHDIDYCRENLTPIGQTKIERMSDFFDLNKDYVVGMATTIRGDFLKLCLPIPNLKSVGFDNWLHDCSNTVDGKAIIKEVLVLHRRHASNVTAFSGLNVDFVTSKKHFSKRGRLLNKTVVEYKSPLALYIWMQKQKVVLLELGYIQSSALDKKIDIQRILVSNLKRRWLILSKPKMYRIRMIVSFYLAGGYAAFSGLKSAIKDVFSD